MTDTDNTNDLALLAYTAAQVESHCLEQPARGISFFMNANKTEFICFKQGASSTSSGRSLKLVDKFTHLGSNISSTESEV